jgi:hypothetical protein
VAQTRYKHVSKCKNNKIFKKIISNTFLRPEKKRKKKKRKVLYPNNDQRNTWESLNKAKRKVLLLWKGTTTDHSLIGRTQWVESQIRFLSLFPST